MTMTQQLRRWTDRVDGDMLRRWSDKANSGLRVTGEAAKSGLDTVYASARNSPRAATAVVLGAGVAAALLWLANRTVHVSAAPARRRKTARRSARKA